MKHTVRRPTVLEERPGLTLAKIRWAYRRAGSLRGAAELLKVSHMTVHKYLAMQGIHGRKGHGSYKGQYVPGWHRSEFAKWLRKHPQVKLPRSPKQIAFMTGCTVDTVKSYFYRRRRFERRRAAEIFAQVMESPERFVLRARDGTAHRLSDLVDVEMSVDDYSFWYHLRGVAEGRTIRFYVNPKELRDACQAIRRESHPEPDLEAGDSTGPDAEVRSDGGEVVRLDGYGGSPDDGGCGDGEERPGDDAASGSPADVDDGVPGARSGEGG